MIEVQIKDKKLYDEMKNYSSYNSDITQVCSFRDELISMIEEYGITDIFKSKDYNKNDIPRLTIVNNNVMKLEGASPEMLAFVGVRSEFDPTIPLRNMREVKMLIDSNLITTTDKFNEVYSKLNYRNKIKELVCSNVIFYKVGKLIDYIDPDLTFTSMKLNDAVIKNVVYKQMEVKVIKNLESKEKYDEILCENTLNNTKIVLRFYNRLHLLKSIAFLQNRFNIACNKISELDVEYFVTYDPIILPNGLDYYNVNYASPPNRKIPADLWRNAYYEFMFRYENN